MAWFILIIAALLETVWALALKYSEGFTRLWPSIVGITSATTSFFLLSIALRSLPVGTSYAVWVGIGVIGVVIAGNVLLEEQLSVSRMIFLIMILVGIIGLRTIES